MGLPERKAIALYQQNVFPKWQQRFNELVGAPVEFEVEWNTLGREGAAEIFEKGFNVIYFEPVVLAIQQIAVDDFSKQAVRDGFKKYFISGAEPADNVFYRFQDKTLFYRYGFSNLENYTHERVQRLVQLFEKNL
ncbi:hypothetical protein ACN469_03960 [Corallococcus terminator]